MSDGKAPMCGWADACNACTDAGRTCYHDRVVKDCGCVRTGKHWSLCPPHMAELGEDLAHVDRDLNAAYEAAANEIDDGNGLLVRINRLER